MCIDDLVDCKAGKLTVLELLAATPKQHHKSRRALQALIDIGCGAALVAVCFSGAGSVSANSNIRRKSDRLEEAGEFRVRAHSIGGFVQHNKRRVFIAYVRV